MPKVSVIMSVYKEPLEWLQQSIESILTQTYTDFEFIIICDNPEYKDGITILKNFAIKDSRIKLLFNENNIGLTKSLNKGLAVVQGEYIARMDADDISVVERFAKEVNFLETHREIDVCHTNLYFIDEEGKRTSERDSKEAQFVEHWFCWENPIAHSSVLFRRALLSKRSPFYNEVFRSAQDYDLWTFLSLEDVKFGFINEPLILYRVSEAQVSRSGRPKQLNNAINIRRNYIFKKLKQLGVVRAEDVTVKEAFQSLQKNDSLISNKEELSHILYLFYFNLSERVNMYGIKYLFDKHQVHKCFDWRHNFYILLHPFFKNRWRMFNLFPDNENI